MLFEVICLGFALAATIAAIHFAECASYYKFKSDLYEHQNEMLNFENVRLHKRIDSTTQQRA